MVQLSSSSLHVLPPRIMLQDDPLFSCIENIFLFYIKAKVTFLRSFYICFEFYDKGIKIGYFFSWSF